MSLRRAINTWWTTHSTTSEWDPKDSAFTFSASDWTIAITDSRTHLPEALAHYDEAIRRQAICALSGRTQEATAWRTIADALNNEFGLKRP